MKQGCSVIVLLFAVAVVIGSIGEACESGESKDKRAAEKAAKKRAAERKREETKKFWSKYPLIETERDFPPIISDEFKSPNGYKVIEAVVGIIRAWGFTCDSVTHFQRSPWSGKYSVTCNYTRYSYEVEDRGGTMVACWKKCK